MRSHSETDYMDRIAKANEATTEFLNYQMDLVQRNMQAELTTLEEHVKARFGPSSIFDDF